MMIDNLALILISPINQSALGIAIAFTLLRFTKIKPWVGKCFMWLSIAWFALCSQYFFSYLLIEPLEKAFPPVKVENLEWKSSDAIWVLACYHFDAESLPLVSQFNHCSIERLLHAANMYRVKAMPIYLTGADFNQSSNLNYASQASKLLVALGVSEQDIITVNYGQNTWSEANALVDKIRNNKLAVVSSATHGFRLTSILSNLNIEFIFVPVHYATKSDNTFTINAPSIQALDRTERAFYEYGALVKYWLIH